MTAIKRTFEAQIPGPFDEKVCNYVVDRVAQTVKVETITDYLARIIPDIRSASVQVAVLTKDGYETSETYSFSEWPDEATNFDTKYYAFIGGLADENFVEIPPSHQPVTIAEESKELLSIDEDQVLTINLDDYVTDDELAEVIDDVLEYIEFSIMANGEDVPVTIAPESSDEATIGSDQVLHLKKKDLSYADFGTITWLHDYTFRLSIYKFHIQGNYFSVETHDVALAAADATYDRIDTFYADSSPATDVITGVASADPVATELDPFTQLFLQNVLVKAGSTSPDTTIEEEIIFNENVEWATALIIAKDGATVDFDNTASHFAGTKQTRATFLPYKFGGIIFSYSKDTDVNISNSNLILSVRTSRTFGATESIYLKLADVWTVKSQPVYIKDGQYGFNSSLTDYQTLTIPFADFKSTTNLINTLRVAFTGCGAGVSGNTTIDFDMIKIQKGIAPVENTETDPVFLKWLANYVPPDGKHNSTTEKQGGSDELDEFYHLTSGQITNLITPDTPIVKIDNGVTEVKIEYGALYNLYVTQGSGTGSLSSYDDWVVPTNTHINSLITAIGGAPNGNKLKSIGLIYWNTNEGTNEFKFNARGTGQRNYSGTFQGIKEYLNIHSNDANDSVYFSSYVDAGEENDNIAGRSIRLCNPSTLLSEGETGEYIGNDGTVYATKVINGVEWLSENLNETQWRDHSYIHGYEAGVYTPISNEDWAALTTEAMCYYNDLESNGATQVAVLTDVKIGGTVTIHKPVTVATASAAFGSIDADQKLTLTEPTYAALPDPPTLGSISPKNYWTGTQAAYDALGSYDSNTIYFVEEA